MAQLQIDLIGMCVVIQQELVTKIGLMDHPGHLHFLTFRDAKGLTTVKALKPGEYHINGAKPGQVKIRDPQQRLPDLATLGGGARTIKEIDELMRVKLILPRGVLKPRRPVLKMAEGPWKLVQPEVCLTDRTTFRCSIAANEAIISAEHQTIELTAKGNKLHAALMAIDQDLGYRRRGIEQGFPLTEFQLFYDCTVGLGPLPVYDEIVAANPDASICPQGLLRLY